MFIQHPIIVLRNIILLSSIITISSCASNDIATMIRKVTYPPNFKYVTGDELRSNMNQLAFQVQQLNNYLLDTTFSQNERQSNVIGTLRNMEKIGSGLQAGDAGTSHPFLQDYMRDFVNDVASARNAASLNKPNYYLAGRITGSCINCHQVNR